MAIWASCNTFGLGFVSVHEEEPCVFLMSILSADPLSVQIFQANCCGSWRGGALLECLLTKDLEWCIYFFLLKKKPFKIIYEPENSTCGFRLNVDPFIWSCDQNFLLSQPQVQMIDANVRRLMLYITSRFESLYLSHIVIQCTTCTEMLSSFKFPILN